MKSAPDTPENQQAMADICAPLGVAGSGRLRYGAAMHFNSIGLLSDAALEVFRICSPLDHEDPANLLGDLDLAHEIPALKAVSGATAIRQLVAGISCYLGGLAGPGIGEIRAGMAKWGDGPATPLAAKRHGLVDSFMPDALGALAKTHPDLATAIGQAVPHLRWIEYGGYPAEQVGQAFLDNHAFAAIVGESNAAIPAVDWELGLFLIAPHVLYRDHKHLAPELYAPLTGPHGWRFGVDKPLLIKPAHEPVWNQPFAPHMTKVGPTPFLCIYAWTGGVNIAAEIVPAPDWHDLETLRLAP